MTTSTIAVDLAATARLTRLITTDRLTRRPRAAALAAAYRRVDVALPPGFEEIGAPVVLDDPQAPDLAYVLCCDWCASMWVGLLVVAARRFVPGVWDPIARALAASYLSGVVASRF